MQAILQGTGQLHQVAEGRLFCRSVNPGYGASKDLAPTLIVGVIALPKYADLERMHLGRINSHLWIDVENSSLPSSRHYMGPQGLAELTANSLLIDLQYRGSILSDSVDLFVRATPLPPHEDRHVRWVFVVGAAARKLQAMPADGLYEIGPGGVKLVSDDPHMGEQPEGVLRKALWGPQGRYGLSSSMEPTHFPKWLQQEREDQRRRHETGSGCIEPLFLPFVELVRERFPDDLPYYTADQEVQKSAYCNQVIRALTAADEALQEDLHTRGEQSPWRYSRDHPREHAAFVTDHARKMLADDGLAASVAAEVQPATTRRRARP